MQPQIIDVLSLHVLQPLLDASLVEGYGFIQKLWDEYESGKTTFKAPDAALMGIYTDEKLVAIGGIHRDPYENTPTIGRVRHVYVLPEYRRKGLGGILVEALINTVHDHYKTITLRTMTDHGHVFYTSLGFSNVPRYPDATHWLDIEQGN